MVPVEHNPQLLVPGANSQTKIIEMVSVEWRATTD